MAEFEAKTRENHLSNNTVRRAIKLLFGNDVTPEQAEKLWDHIQMKYKHNECVALYISDSDRAKVVNPKTFLALCEKIGLDPGKREVIITSGGEKILFTKDYTKTPFPV